MFIPWIKRSSLKRSQRGKRLIMTGERPSMILLLSLSVLFVLLGVFVVQRSWAQISAPASTPAASALPLAPR